MCVGAPPFIVLQELPGILCLLTMIFCVYQSCYCVICYNVTIFAYKTESDMAMTINSSPVLTGESARAFIEGAYFRLATAAIQPQPLETRFMFFDLKCE